MLFQFASSEVHQLSPDREHGLCEGQVGDTERRGGKLQEEHRDLQSVSSERNERAFSKSAWPGISTLKSHMDSKLLLHLKTMLKDDPEGKIKTYVYSKYNLN